LYRNDIKDVAKFLEEAHEDNYWVFNVSGIEYDTLPFKGMVSTEAWEDHHSPTLTLLAKLCQNMHDFMEKDPNNVVVVHCNAGKGRTGALICCYMLFCGFADSAKTAI